MRRFTGWKGILVEADQAAYRELKGHSGRGASLLHHVPQGKGGRYVFQTIHPINGFEPPFMESRFVPRCLVEAVHGIACQLFIIFFGFIRILWAGALANDKSNTRINDRRDRR